MWDSETATIRRDTFVVEISPAVQLEAELWRPPSPIGLVVFAHGSGSSRSNPRDRYVAELLHRAGLGTLLIDLLTVEEINGLHERFSLETFGDRVTPVIDQLVHDPCITEPIGLFAVGTGAVAAIAAAVARPTAISAIVCRSGRPDLAGTALGALTAPLLMIAGADDEPVLDFNRTTLADLPGGSTLEIVDGATNLFDEPGALDEVAELAGSWFVRHLGAGSGAADRRVGAGTTTRSTAS